MPALASLSQADIDALAEEQAAQDAAAAAAPVATPEAAPPPVEAAPPPEAAAAPVPPPYDPAQDTQGQQAQPNTITAPLPETSAEASAQQKVWDDSLQSYVPASGGTPQPAYVDTGAAPPESTQQTIAAQPVPDPAPTWESDSTIYDPPKYTPAPTIYDPPKYAPIPTSASSSVAGGATSFGMGPGVAAPPPTQDSRLGPLAGGMWDPGHNPIVAPGSGGYTTEDIAGFYEDRAAERANASTIKTDAGGNIALGLPYLGLWDGGAMGPTDANYGGGGGRFVPPEAIDAQGRPFTPARDMTPTKPAWEYQSGPDRAGRVPPPDVPTSSGRTVEEIQADPFQGRTVFPEAGLNYSDSRQTFRPGEPGSGEAALLDSGDYTGAAPQAPPPEGGELPVLPPEMIRLRNTWEGEEPPPPPPTGPIRSPYDRRWSPRKAGASARPGSAAGPLPAEAPAFPTAPVPAPDARPTSPGGANFVGHPDGSVSGTGYHGSTVRNAKTARDINDAPGAMDASLGTRFDANPDAGQQYNRTTEPTTLYGANVALKKPLRLQASDVASGNIPDLATLRPQGYDGIVVNQPPGRGGGIDYVVAFDDVPVSAVGAPTTQAGAPVPPPEAVGKTPAEAAPPEEAAAKAPPAEEPAAAAAADAQKRGLLKRVVTALPKPSKKQVVIGAGALGAAAVKELYQNRDQPTAPVPTPDGTPPAGLPTTSGRASGISPVSGVPIPAQMKGAPGADMWVVGGPDGSPAAIGITNEQGQYEPVPDTMTQDELTARLQQVAAAKATAPVASPTTSSTGTTGTTGPAKATAPAPTQSAAPNTTGSPASETDTTPGTPLMTADGVDTGLTLHTDGTVTQGSGGSNGDSSGGPQTRSGGSFFPSSGRYPSGSRYKKKKKKTGTSSIPSGMWDGFPFNRPPSPIRQLVLDAIAASKAKGKSSK